MKDETSISTFQELDIRVGEVVEAEENVEARDPAYKMWVDFGEEIGTLKTSAKLKELYKPGEIEGKLVVAVVNFPDKQIADMMSECLVLGALGEQGTSLLTVDKKVGKGTKIA